MNRTELEQIVELVTRQVLEAIGGAAADGPPQAEGLPRVLAVGGAEQALPQELTEGSVVLDIEDHVRHRDILRYDRVVITGLTVTQLADIAQGRAGDEVSSAVISALLNGVETWMLEEALTFRRSAGKGSTALYRLLERYVQTIQTFGVKLICRSPQKDPPKVRPAQYALPRRAVPGAGLLVTEDTALRLIREGPTVTLPAGAIVTPSARDAFAQARVELIQEH